MTDLCAFAMEGHHSAGQVQITYGQSGSFTGTRSRIIEKQQQGVVATTLWFTPIWCCKQGLHFVFLQIHHGSGSVLLQMNSPNLMTPFEMFRGVYPYESHPGAQSGQPLVNGGGPTTPGMLQV